MKMQKTIKKRLKDELLPLIDGNTATFVWKGKEAPYLVGDFTGWDAGEPLVLQKEEPGTWTYQLSLPLDAYIEYAFNIEQENLLDPLNARKIKNGVSGYNNYFSMPEFIPTHLSKKNKEISHGIVTSYNVPTDHFIKGENRWVHLYHPPTKDPVPLLVVWDGQDYLNRMHLNYILDNLIDQKKIRPLALALVNHGGQKTRILEYGCSEASLFFLQTRVLPLANNHLNLLDIKNNPGVYGVAGASMGGLMALYTGIRMPKVFGNILSQSGAFTWTDYDLVVFDLLRNCKNLSLNIWMDVGVYDLPGLLDANRRMNEILLQQGYSVSYREYNAGHNYPAWENDIWRGLEFLYGIK